MNIKISRILTEYYAGKKVKSDALFYNRAEKDCILEHVVSIDNVGDVTITMSIFVDTDDNCIIDCVSVDFDFQYSEPFWLKTEDPSLYLTIPQCLGAADDYMNMILDDKEY